MDHYQASHSGCSGRTYGEWKESALDVGIEYPGAR